MFESWAARERECREGTLVTDLRSRVSCLQTGITWLTRAGGGKVISLHTQTAATRGGHKEHNPSIYPPVQPLASGIKTYPAKKPRAESLDRCEVIKEPSGLGSGFTFTVSSKLWECQMEKNEGSRRELFACLHLYSQIVFTLSLFLAHPMALRSGSVMQ